MSRSFISITAILLLAIAATIITQNSHSSWAQAVRSESKTYRVTHPTSPPSSGNQFGMNPPAGSAAQPAGAKQGDTTTRSPSTGTADTRAEKGARMGGMMGAMAGEMMMGGGMEDTGMMDEGMGSSGGMMGGGMGDSGEMMGSGMGDSGGMMGSSGEMMMGGEMDGTGMMDGGMGPSGGMMGGYGGMMGGPAGGIPYIQVQLRREASRLRQAKTVEAKERSKKALEALLGDYFDSDMRRRQAELLAVKQRVAKLEALFERRQAAKEEIIELQLRMTVNESEGLGFFSEPAPRSIGSEYGGYGGGSFEMDSGMGGGYGME
jgi:hypothetical protein